MPKGPTPRGEYVGKSSVFSTRIRPDLRQKLEQAAKKSGRSLSQEIEHRLRRTFVEDEKTAENFGDRRTFLLMRMMAMAIRFKGDDDQPGKWLENPEDFEIAIAAALSVLEAVRPPGPIGSGNPFLAHFVRTKAEGISFDIWNEIKKADPALPITRGTHADHWNAMTKADLGEIADRVRLPASDDDEGNQ
jgi:hypothetical protein